MWAILLANARGSCTGRTAKGVGRALTSVAQWVGHHITKQKVTSSIPVGAHAWVAGLVPNRGTCKRRLITVSLLLFLPPSLSCSLKT